MYLPLGSTFLHLLQLPLSLSPDFDQPTLNSPGPGEGQLGHHHHREKKFNNLGNLSPYHDAPTDPQVSQDLPADCTINQVILLHRHGSRGPAGEQHYIVPLVTALEEAKDIIRDADLPPELEFLKEGYKYRLVPEELSIIGRKELFEHGIEFALRYPTFLTDTVVSTTSPRVIDSAHFFAQGFFGRGAEKINFLTSDDLHKEPIPWLMPWTSCPKHSFDEAREAAKQWQSEYIPRIEKRLNKLIPGFEFSTNGIHGALYACPYDLAAGHESPWCSVFTKRELRHLEYELDLLLDRASGRASRGDPGPLFGAFYVKELIKRLNDEDAKSLYLEFGHDINILYILSAMGLNKDAAPLSPTDPSKHRKFRSSHQTPFAANMVWEKFTCENSFEGPQVRLVLNGATFPLSICEKTEHDKEYGTCSVDEFVLANKWSEEVEYRNEAWNAACER